MFSSGGISFNLFSVKIELPIGWRKEPKRLPQQLVAAESTPVSPPPVEKEQLSESIARTSQPLDVLPGNEKVESPVHVNVVPKYYVQLPDGQRFPIKNPGYRIQARLIRHLGGGPGSSNPNAPAIATMVGQDGIKRIDLLRDAVAMNVFPEQVAYDYDPLAEDRLPSGYLTSLHPHLLYEEKFHHAEVPATIDLRNRISIKEENLRKMWSFYPHDKGLWPKGSIEIVIGHVPSKAQQALYELSCL